MAALGVAMASGAATHSAESARSVATALWHVSDSNDRQHVWPLLELAADHLAATSRLEAAARIVGRLEHEQRGHAVHGEQRAGLPARVEADSGAGAALVEGRRMPRDDLVRMALAVLDGNE